MKDLDNNSLVNVSHELKTPITNLILLLETFYEYEKTLSDYHRKEIIELCIYETRRLKNLIDLFLYFKKNIKRDHNYLPEMIADLGSSYTILSFYKDFFLTYSFYGYSQKEKICVDSKVYSHIILNLLENASKFTRQSGKGWIVSETDTLTSLNLSSFTKLKYGRSSIVDNGVGISNKSLLSIRPNSDFNTLKPQSLGLRIIKDLLIIYNIYLHGSSYPFRGARFFFTIEFTEKI
jgi:signal transduction histidine kinase